ncbi:MAG: YeeE/YedE thiosulfate transporter family protein [Candidatus Promineifilaceae bacterium]
MAPFPLSEILGNWGAYLVYLLIGFAFGFVLEMAGFGNSTKLAAQFYFKDMTVLKVMFTAIVVAMVGIFLSAALGILDYRLVWVNPTYLWPGIVGGLIMGAGFIVGGFCPGTSLVAAATLKLDGLFFVLGAFFGIFLFGETVSLFEDFWNSSYLGRFTIPQWLNLPTGVVVVLIVLMALFMFWGSEQLERIFGKKDPRQAPKWRYGAAGALLLGAVLVMFLGQPSTADRWAKLEPTKGVLLAERKVQIHPGELLALTHDDKMKVMLIDVRNESDYNQFHILDAQHIPLETLPDRLSELQLMPANTVFVTMSNDEGKATEAWKVLVAESIPNAYILEGGVNGWLDTFASSEFRANNSALVEASTGANDQLRYTFVAALGARNPAAEPNPEAYELEYMPKVELKAKRGPTGGGCG